MGRTDLHLLTLVSLLTGCPGAPTGPGLGGGDTDAPSTSDANISGILARLDAVEDELDAAEGRVAVLETALAETVALISYVDAQDGTLDDAIALLETRVTMVESDRYALDGRLTTVEAEYVRGDEVVAGLPAVLSVDVTGERPVVRFDGANVAIAGADGAGNLWVGPPVEVDLAGDLGDQNAYVGSQAVEPDLAGALVADLGDGPDLSPIYDRLDGHDVDIGGLTGRVTSAEGRLTDVEGDAAAALGGLGELDGRVSTLEGAGFLDLAAADARYATPADLSANSIDDRAYCDTVVGDLELPDLGAYATVAYVDGADAALDGRVSALEDSGFLDRPTADGLYATPAEVAANSVADQDYCDAQVAGNAIADQAYCDALVDGVEIPDLGPYATVAYVDAADDALDERVDAVDNTSVRVLDGDVVLRVPDDFDTVNDALAHLEGFSIGRDASATVELSIGAHIMDEPVTVRHADGDRIMIRSAVDGELAELQFIDTNGIVVSNGATLGLLQDVALMGEGSGVGLVAEAGSRVTVGGTLSVDGFGDGGVHADDGGFVHAPSGIDVSNSHACFAATNGGVVDAPDSTAVSCTYGFRARHASVIVAEGSDADDNSEQGYYADANSVILAFLSTATGNKHGYYADHGGYIFARSTTATSNGDGVVGNGYEMLRTGHMDLQDASAVDNEVEGFLAHQLGFGSAPFATSVGSPVDFEPEVPVDSATVLY